MSERKLVRLTNKNKIIYESLCDSCFAKLEFIATYINENSKLPSIADKVEEVKTLGKWIWYIKYNYNKRIRCMTNNANRIVWESFYNTYKKYFLLFDEVWFNNLEEVMEYIDKNGKLPSSTGKIKKVKTLGEWIQNNKNNYDKGTQCMKNNDIKEAWEEFNKDYKVYIDHWCNNLENVKEYSDKNGKLPSNINKFCICDKCKEYLIISDNPVILTIVIEKFNERIQVNTL